MYTNSAGFGKSRTPEEKEENIKRTSHLKSEYNNPCVKEQEMSYKCLNDNNYNRESCTVYFANYKNCKEFWNKVKSDRRAKGQEPILPWPEEREQIKAEYMEKKKMKNF